MAHSFAVSAPAPGSSERFVTAPKLSAIEVAREGRATIVRLVVPEALSRGGRIFTELTDLAIAGHGRLVICLCKATECTQEWLGALSSLARRCELLGGRLIVCGTVKPLEEDFERTALARRVRAFRNRHALSRPAGQARERSPTPV